MSTSQRCHCPSCTVRSLSGPAVVITLGILILLHQIRGGHLSIANTWPVLLLVLGAIQLASAFAPRDGHVEIGPGLPPSSVPPAVPPVNPPQTYSSAGEQ